MLKVTEQKIYILGRSLRQDELDTAQVKYVQGSVEGPGPRLHDETIESKSYRAKYTSDGEGMICISVEPGEELGQIAVNIQFEGPVGRHNQCIKQQNGILKIASEQLKDFFSKFREDFEVRIGAVPCPDAEEKLNLAEVVNCLEGRVENSVQRGPRRENPVDVVRKTES